MEGSGDDRRVSERLAAHNEKTTPKRTFGKLDSLLGCRHGDGVYNHMGRRGAPHLRPSAPWNRHPFLLVRPVCPDSHTLVPFVPLDRMGVG